MIVVGMVLYQCSNSGTKSGGHENRGLSVRTRDYIPLVVVPSPRSEATSRTAKVKYVQVAAKALTCNNIRRSTRSFRVICMQEVRSDRTKSQLRITRPTEVYTQG